MTDSNSTMTKFTYGEAVTVKHDAPFHMHPGRWASICGFISGNGFDYDPLCSKLDPDWHYTIEFDDGSSIEIQEKFLEKYTPGAG